MEKETFINYGNGVFFYVCDPNEKTYPESVKFVEALSKFIGERDVKILSVAPIIPAYAGDEYIIIIVDPYIGNVK
jgi:hypothetical protein